MLKRHGRRTPENLLQSAYIGAGMLDIAQAGRFMMTPDFLSRKLFKMVQQLQQGMTLSGADIEYSANTFRPVSRARKQLREIGHIHEIARLRTIAVYRDRLIPLQAIDKNADHARIRRGWILPQAVDIEETKRRGSKIIFPVVVQQIIFAGQLVHGI